MKKVPNYDIYKPGGMELSSQLQDIIELMTENVHNIWMKSHETAG